MSVPDRVQIRGGDPRTKVIDPTNHIIDISEGSPWSNPWKVVLIDGQYYAADEFNRVGPCPSLDAAYNQTMIKFEKYVRVILARIPTWMDPLKKAEHLACRCSQGQKCHGYILIKLLKEMDHR
jgi:hypothetical protein